MNITISIDEEVVEKVRRVALEKDTTLTAMVCDYLISVANDADATRKAHADRLMETLERSSRDIGPRTWTRDNLYDERLDRRRR